MFKLSSIGKAVTQALNAAPDVDELSKSLGTPSVEPRLVAEYGGVHGATCLDYDPTQRVLAVGVDVGVKILGADGLELVGELGDAPLVPLGGAFRARRLADRLRGVGREVLGVTPPLTSPRIVAARRCR